MAEAYQAAFETAKEQSGIGPLVEARPALIEALQKSGDSVFAVPARTAEGLRIKAHAFTAFARSPHSEKVEWQAKLWWSAPLAENVLSVIGTA